MASPLPRLLSSAAPPPNRKPRQSLCLSPTVQRQQHLQGAPNPAYLQCAPNRATSPTSPKTTRSAATDSAPTHRHKAVCPWTTRASSSSTTWKGTNGSLTHMRRRRKPGRVPRRKRPPPPNPRGHHTTSSDRSPLLPAPAKPPPPVTACPNDWETLRLDSDNDMEFRSEIDLGHPQEQREATDT